MAATPPEPSIEPEELSGTKSGGGRDAGDDDAVGGAAGARRPSRRPMLAIGAIAAVAVIAGAIALLAGGGDGRGLPERASRDGERTAATRGSPGRRGRDRGGQQSGEAAASPSR